MRKLTKKELRAIVLEVKKSGFDLEKTYVIVDAFSKEGWHGLGLTFMDGKKSMRVVMPLRSKPTLDEITKQLGRVYKDIRVDGRTL